MIGHTVIEAQKGRPGDGARLEPKVLHENHEPGGSGSPVTGAESYMPSGCLIRHSTQSVGEPRTLGKDLTEVRSPQRKLVPDTVGPDKGKPTSLRGIANRARARKHHRFRDLYGLLDAEFLLTCWQDLNKDAASGVEGVTALARQSDSTSSTMG